MSSQPTRLSRQRPAGTSGPSRDVVRDRRLTDAALTLLAEGGEAVTMEKTAALAGVGKATVYRRWASRADLVADALETVGFADPTVADAAGDVASFRDDLVQTLIRVTGCLDPERHRLVVVGTMAATHHPELASSLAARLTTAVDQAIAAAVDRARQRGEARLRAPADTMPATSVVALLNYLPTAQNRPLAASDFDTIVDRVLLPLLTQS